MTQTYKPRPRFTKPNLGHPIRASSFVFRKLRRGCYSLGNAMSRNSIASLRATRPDLNSKEIKPLLDQNHKQSDSEVVGQGECVDLTKKFSGMLKEDKDMGTYRWRPGPKVVDDKDIKPGTAIANFNSKGRFPNKHTYNSGIYLNSGSHGSIWILDQWPGHPPRVREVFLDNRKEPADNAAAYSVIYATPR